MLFSKLCRCCLGAAGNLNVFETQYEYMFLWEIIEKCTHSTLSNKEDLPKTVCQSCFNTLTAFFSFIIKYQTVQKTLSLLIINGELSNSFNQPKELLEENKQIGNSLSQPKDLLELKNQTKVKWDLTKDFEEIKNDFLDDNIDSVKDDLDNAIENEIEIYSVDSGNENVPLLNEGTFNSELPKNNNYETLLSKYSLDDKCTVTPAKDQDANKLLEKNSKYIENKILCTNEENMLEEYRKDSQNGICKNDKESIKDIANEISCTDENFLIFEDDCKNIKIEMTFEIDDDKNGLLEECSEDVENDLSSTKEECEPVLTDNTIGEDGYRCPDCDLSFQYLTLLKRHCRATGHQPLRRFACEICPAKFEFRRIMRNHIRTHTKEKPYTCDVCGLKLRTTDTLSRHKTTHAEQKFLFFCAMCDGKGFKRKYSYIRHLRAHNGYKGDDKIYKKYREQIECPICRKMLVTGSMKNHVIRHGNDINELCTICGMTFKIKANFDRHMIKHSGRYTCECEICGRMFRFRKNLKDHIRTHIGERPFSCDACPKRLESIWCWVECKIYIKMENKEIIEILKQEDYLKLCRCCMENDGNIFEYEYEFLWDIIGKCTQSTSNTVSLYHQLPKMICQSCFDKLKSFYEFIAKYQNVQEILSSLITNRTCPTDSLTEKYKIDEISEITNFKEDIEENEVIIQELIDESECLQIIVDHKDSVDVNDSKQIEIYRVQNKYNKKKYKKSIKSDVALNSVNEDKDGSLTDYSCTLCPQSFSNLKLLKKHNKTHMVKKTTCISENCTECHLNFPSLNSLSKHCQESGHRRPGRFDCEICSKKFFTKFRLKVHMRVHTKERPHMCDSCGRSFSLESNLKRHILSHIGEKKFFCEICGQGYTQKHTLDTHKIKHHYENTGSSVNLSTEKKIANVTKVQCSVCKKFLTKHSMPNHMATQHRDENAKRFSCDLCEKTFPTKVYLYLHTNSHTRKKKFQCKICSKIFFQSVGLINHMRLHSGERPYCCDICGKTFIQHAHLYVHKKLHAGIKPHKCTFCNKSFTLPGTLRIHVRIHTGETPYRCDVCDKGFFDTSSRKKHEISVHKFHRPNKNKATIKSIDQVEDIIMSSENKT